MTELRIAALLSTNTAYGRGVYRGVLRYATGARPWRLEKGAPSSEQLRRWLSDHPPDGIIAHLASPAVAETVASAGIPAVNVSGLLPDSPVPRVLPDNIEVGRLAARELIARGHSRLVCIGFIEHYYSRLRVEGFCEVSGERLVAKLYHEGSVPALVKPLAEGSLPVGVFCVNDALGAATIRACHEIGLRVPQDLAVIGVDNDEIVAESVTPHLSSIDLGTDRLGYEAARLLDGLIGGLGLTGTPLVTPVGLVCRASADHVAVDDPLVRAALACIASHAATGMQVKELADHVGASRRWLELRMFRALGVTPADELRRARVELCKRALAQTDRDLEQVAERCGFSNAKQMGRTFTRLVGMTPTAWRRQFRLR